jgi:DNA repair photolyase
MSTPPRPGPRGRGSSSNPQPRFRALRLSPEELVPEGDGESADPRTLYLLDSTREIVARNQSPDVGFDASVNPYRGCEHGCVYCYARPSHEYLDFSAGLDFETRILVKPDAPRLLRRALCARSWRPQVIAMSGVTDCYQPVERRLRLTRGCLEVLSEFRNPVAVITKSTCVARDVDLLAELARWRCASVAVSLTTLDDDLARSMEPRAAQPRARLRTVEALARAGIPVGVMLAPLIPGLTDHEIPRLLQAARAAGAGWASYVLLRLPHGTRDLFEQWLQERHPQRAARVLQRIRDVRGGRLYDSRWSERQRGTGLWAEQLAGLFALSRSRAGLAERGPELSTAHFRRVAGDQLDLGL